MWHFRRMGARSRRGSTDVLWPACTAAPWPGIGGNRRGRRRHGYGPQGSGPARPRVLQRRPVDALRPAGRGSCALRHCRRQELGSLSAAPLYHQQCHYRACSQRHSGQHRRAAPPADRAGRAVPLQFGFRGRDQTHRLLYSAYRPSARGHSQDHGARARRLRHDAHQRAGALRIP